MTGETSASLLEFLSAIGTFAAAVIAAYSAILSRKSAKAALETVEEARRARRDELLPRFVLDKDFLDFKFLWPHIDTLNGEPVFLARRHWKDQAPTPPTFTLSNFGQGPAYEVRLIFELVDLNGDFAIPDTFQALGITNGMPISSPSHPSIPIVQFAMDRTGKGSGLPLYRRQRIDIPNIVPGQPRSIEFPQGILARIFVRGLQYLTRRPEICDMMMMIVIEGYTAEGELVRSQFRFHVTPFCYSAGHPVEVNGHFWELAMFPEDKDTKQALA